MTKELIKTIRAFSRNESGSTAIEYAIVAAGISVAIVSVLGMIGETVRNDLFQKIATALGA